MVPQHCFRHLTLRGLKGWLAIDLSPLCRMFQLTVLFEIHDQVLLALEPVGQFLSLHVTQGALLVLGHVVVFHILIRWIL